MSIRAAVNQYIASRPAIVAIAGTRVNPIKRPQNQPLPAITVRRITGGHNHNLGAASDACMPVVLVTIWAADVETMDALAEAVRLEMQSAGGANLVWGTGRRSIHVTDVTLDDETDDFIPNDIGGEDGAFKTEQQYTIQHHETTPEPEA